MSTITPEREGGEGAPLPQSHSARLTEEEARLVAKLLSDPTYFPIEFRTWLKQYIEGSGITLPASQVKGGGSGDRTGLPAGVIITYPVAALPPDCLLCDGLAVSRTDFVKLFEIIGVTWGAGNGTTTFNIPDLRDRALYCIGGRIGLAATDGIAHGSRGGPHHHHGVGIASDTQGGHNHGGGTDWEGGHTHGLSGLTGSQRMLPNEGFTWNYLSPVGGPETGGGGDHDHGIGWDGDHQHWIGGVTDGGYGDTPSFAGVAIAITTGR